MPWSNKKQQHEICKQVRLLLGYDSGDTTDPGSQDEAETTTPEQEPDNTSPPLSLPPKDKPQPESPVSDLNNKRPHSDSDLEVNNSNLFTNSLYGN